MGRISFGWIITPIIACVISFIALFILQNVFNQNVFKITQYIVNDEVLFKLKNESISIDQIQMIKGKTFLNAVEYKTFLKKNYTNFNNETISRIIFYSCSKKVKIDLTLIKKEIKEDWISSEQIKALKKIEGIEFNYTWKFRETLGLITPSWVKKKENIKNKRYNKDLESKFKYIERKFLI